MKYNGEHPAGRLMSEAIAHTRTEGGEWIKGPPDNRPGSFHTILFGDGWVFDRTLFERGIDGGARKVKFLPHFDKDGKSLPLCGHCGGPAPAKVTSYGGNMIDHTKYCTYLDCRMSGKCREVFVNCPAKYQIGLIETRETTHGPYNKTARIAQDLKAHIRRTTNWGAIPSEQREALEMIMHKVARILEGKSTHADHWDDIAGYAELGKKATYSD